ncbi:MAG: Fic family protein [Acidobacteria bacterium]|nr:Fic family protein [Acidobacteriota bacterium]
MERTNQSLGRLDGLGSLLPDLELFIYAYVLKEAVLSSQIEGTQSSLSDLLLFENDEAPGVPITDVQEVSNYVAALKHGLARLRQGFPLSLRLIREIHSVLLAEGRGSDKDPVEFRRSQNWIGGTRPGTAIFVPPPPDLVMECMGALELFMHEERRDVPPLVKAGLVHVQFESIHPFLDGNGRIGRLLITFLLCATGALREPILYLSLFFKAHRQAYYDLLMRVRETGDWESWIEFFLQGVKETSEQAVNAAQRILALLNSDRKKIETLGRSSASMLRVFHYAQTRPILNIQNCAEALAVSFPTVSTAVDGLERLGVLREVTGRQRKRLFGYDAYLGILNEGIEPLRQP